MQAENKKSPFGIEGYEMAAAASSSRKVTIGKSKELNLIEIVSKRATKVPGVGQYSNRYEKTWDLQERPNKQGFTKAPRIFESEKFEQESKIPGKATPGPQAYSVLESKQFPAIGRSGPKPVIL